MSANDDSEQESFECTVNGCERTFDSEGGMVRHRGAIHPDKLPWKDPERLRQGYIEERKSIYTLAEEWGCGDTAVQFGLEDAGIPRRTASETKQIQNTRRPVPVQVNSGGYVVWKHSHKNEKSEVPVHVLIAIADGASPHRVFSDGVDVHHGPHAEIPWANWDDNLQVVTKKEHIEHHHVIDEDELLEDIRRVASELGRSPELSAMLEHGNYGKMVYYRTFGSWTNAKKAAGVQSGECKTERNDKGQFVAWESKVPKASSKQTTLTEADE